MDPLPATTRRPRGRSRPGFTLLELLLVLALVVIVYSLAGPALRVPMAAQRLDKGVEQIRTEWMRAHNVAMRTGRTLGFQYQPSSGTYRIQDWSPPQARLASGADGGPEPLPSSWDSDGQLPDGVVMARGTIDDSRSQYVYADPQRTAGAGDGWSQPVLFFPDGTCSDASLILVGENGDQLGLTLRGLTGTVRRVESTGEEAGP